MADWTHKNLRDVEDKAPGFGMGDIQSARFAFDDLGAESTGVRPSPTGTRTPRRSTSSSAAPAA
jgi:hypothetical protein